MGSPEEFNLATFRVADLSSSVVKLEMISGSVTVSQWHGYLIRMHPVRFIDGKCTFFLALTIACVAVVNVVADGIHSILRESFKKLEKAH